MASALRELRERRIRKCRGQDRPAKQGPGREVTDSDLHRWDDETMGQLGHDESKRSVTFLQPSEKKNGCHKTYLITAPRRHKT